MNWLSWIKMPVTAFASHARYFNHVRDPAVFRLMVDNRFERHCQIGKITIKRFR